MGTEASEPSWMSIQCSEEKFLCCFEDSAGKHVLRSSWRMSQSQGSCWRKVHTPAQA